MNHVYSPKTFAGFDAAPQGGTADGIDPDAAKLLISTIPFDISMHTKL
jgi:hypothetical protein